MPLVKECVRPLCGPYSCCSAILNARLGHPVPKARDTSARNEVQIFVEERQRDGPQNVDVV